VFEEWLIDHEAACNIGNWQWLSCTAFFSQFFRCYSPIAFPQKWDKEGAFVRRYVPELANFDKKYIYEPWKAPIADQKKWGCTIKGDGATLSDGNIKLYPKPMFDFPTQRDICLQGMKNAYHIGLRGNSPKVLNGTWRELFDDDAEGPTQGIKGPPGAMVEHEDVNGNDNHAGESGILTMPKKTKTKVETKTMETNDVAKKGGRKRQATQGTLDGMVMRKKKKVEA
jgi:cryptochrome